jgi:branched-subunit amino acid transport protein
LVLGLAGLSFAMRGAGPVLPSIPAVITERTTGLAPALLAGLVASQLTDRHGIIHIDLKVLAVMVAAILAALRMPLLVCVIAGAALAAFLRAVFHFA